MSLRSCALIAVAVALLGIAENLLFGVDKGGLRHSVSVGFFFLTVVAVVALVAIGALAVIRQLRTGGVAR